MVVAFLFLFWLGAAGSVASSSDSEPDFDVASELTEATSSSSNAALLVVVVFVRDFGIFDCVCNVLSREGRG